ncbi:hypothetical protein BC833DRAFT_576870 [Globomyces pollinis-pini]|nr:hypothetical protein BC833DRAFT_576870 [Globomyces pollinis-pini]
MPRSGFQYPMINLSLLITILFSTSTITWDIIRKSERITTSKTCLPITRTQFLAYLRCTEAFADDFMEA